jgi:aminopeptidase-like protein
MNRQAEIESYLKKLFPIVRSLAGEGNRQTLRILNELIPIKIKEYSSGLEVYDWTIPREWSICAAYIKDSRGNRLIDLRHSNLHVVNYSQPIKEKLTLEELSPHLHYLEDHPDAIPYRTTYYKENWGFCLTHNQHQSLIKDGGPFEVLIDSCFEDGSMTIGEILIEGSNKQEVLISTYICHPSLANDNLSGMILTAFLAKEILSRNKLNRTYRIIFVPETIGAISYCAMNENIMKAINVGLVIATVGGPGKLGYKQSFNREHYLNSLIEETFREEKCDFITYPFDIHGSDERQYSSQGFRINVASICKDKYYEYPDYHTSLDNLDFVKAEYIEQTLHIYLKLIEKLERTPISNEAENDLKNPTSDSDFNLVYRNNYPHCEIMLSKHGLYPVIGGGQSYNSQVATKKEIDIILWLLFYCDGKRPLSYISKEINVSLDRLLQVANALDKKGIMDRVD